MLGGKGKGGRVGQRESPSGTEVSPCLRVANLQKIFFLLILLQKDHILNHEQRARVCAPSLLPVAASQHITFDALFGAHFGLGQST
jgi:hypothetical protein